MNQGLPIQKIAPTFARANNAARMIIIVVDN